MNIVLKLLDEIVNKIIGGMVHVGKKLALHCCGRFDAKACAHVAILADTHFMSK
jgi:hypothetical protein